jgi:hypothetical protein
MSQSTPTITTPQPQLRLPTAADVALLAAERHPMCLSVLLTTTPSERMVPGDRATLQGLTLDALRRLDEEPDLEAAAATRAGLAVTISHALVGPTDRGLAILVSPEGTHLLHLRVAPRNRVVVDPTFATRDLVRSAAEDPAFLTLVIDGRAARLLHYGQRYTRPILGHDFPMIRPDEGQRASASAASSDRARQERTRAFLREVDSRVAARIEEFRLPVVLVASERTAAQYLGLAPGRRIAAVVRTGNGNTPVADLEQAARAALAEHVSDRAAAALDTVSVRLAHGRAVAGLAAAWEAIVLSDPDLLVVERSHAAAARVSEDGLDLVADPEELGVLDDAVDELIEAALARGAEVVTVPDGALARHGHLVLALRGPAPARVG